MEGMPPFIRIEQLMAMAKSAREHGDQACAKELISEAQAIRRQSRWMAEDEIPMMVRLAADEFRVGDRDRAEADVAAALAMFDSERERILSSKRTESLLSIAEAYHAMGNGRQAMAVYRRAVAEGGSNPNGRPRALDLSALCRSLALNAVEPDVELWREIREALNGLGPPW
jgi:tetratricopeptide (TPR) repeat protein